MENTTPQKVILIKTVFKPLQYQTVNNFTNWTFKKSILTTSSIVRGYSKIKTICQNSPHYSQLLMNSNASIVNIRRLKSNFSKKHCSVSSRNLYFTLISLTFVTNVHLIRIIWTTLHMLCQYYAEIGIENYAPVQNPQGTNYPSRLIKLRWNQI